MPKRKQYTIELKKKIIQEVEVGVKSSEVGRKYDISHTLISKWYKDRYNITGMGDDNSKRMRYSKEPKLDKSLVLWIEKTRRSKVNINGL